MDNLNKGVDYNWLNMNRKFTVIFLNPEPFFGEYSIYFFTSGGCKTMGLSFCLLYFSILFNIQREVISQRNPVENPAKTSLG